MKQNFESIFPLPEPSRQLQSAYDSYTTPKNEVQDYVTCDDAHPSPLKQRSLTAAPAVATGAVATGAKRMSSDASDSKDFTQSESSPKHRCPSNTVYGDGLDSQFSTGCFTAFPPQPHQQLSTSASPHPILSAANNIAADYTARRHARYGAFDPAGSAAHASARAVSAYAAMLAQQHAVLQSGQPGCIAVPAVDMHDMHAALETAAQRVQTQPRRHFHAAQHAQFAEQWYISPSGGSGGVMCSDGRMPAVEVGGNGGQWHPSTSISSGLPTVSCAAAEAQPEALSHTGLPKRLERSSAPLLGEFKAGSMGDGATTGSGSSMHHACTATAAPAHLHSSVAAWNVVSTGPQGAVESATRGTLGSRIHSPPAELADNASKNPAIALQLLLRSACTLHASVDMRGAEAGPGSEDAAAHGEPFMVRAKTERKEEEGSGRISNGADDYCVSDAVRGGTRRHCCGMHGAHACVSSPGEPCCCDIAMHYRSFASVHTLLLIVAAMLL